LGHIAGFIGADFLARYFRLKGNKVLFVSGSDCHGTPIEVKAEKEKKIPKEIVEKYDKEFRDNFKKLGFSFDLYTKTAGPFHYKKVQEKFLDLYEKKLIYRKTQELTYCEKCKRFLPDRYVEGECPKCHFDQARGDQCDECGTLLDTKELINPKCKTCGAAPVWKEAEHFFLKLTAFKKEILSWIKKSSGWRANAKKFTINFIEKGLVDRAITRDSKWGIPVPIKGYENKSIYVWFEAVSGYLTASKQYSKKIGKDNLWKEFWNKKSFHYYVHGKDNIPFHSIIWPAILIGLGNLKLPDRIVSSEYLSYEGKQFSTSRNWGIWLPDFLKQYEPDTLRYYLAINGPENADSDFNIKEFKTRVNTELLGKFGNFVNRVINFTNNNFNGSVPKKISNEELIKKGEKLFDTVGKLIEETKFQEAIKKIRAYQEECNRFIDKKEPWKTIKKDKEEAGNTIYTCIQAISIIQTLLSPFLPFTSNEIQKQLNISSKDKWKYFEIKSGHKLGKAKPIFKRI